MGKAKMKGSSKFLIIALAVLLVLTFLNYGVVSSWGKVRIERIKLMGDNGKEYSALMYIPKEATNENPAPAIIMFHGGNGNARNHEAWSLEFSRRGYVALSIDFGGAGNTESVGTTESSQETCNFFYEYLAMCPFVKSDQIITSGHSAGSEMALLVGVKYKAAAILACSGIRPLTKTGYEGNIQASLGSVEPYDTVERGLEFFTTNARLGGVNIPEGQTIEYGKVYGSFAEHNAHRYMLIDKQIHEGVFIDKNLIREIIWFAQEAVPAPHPLDQDDQVWPAKDVIGMITIFAFLAFILSLVVFLIDHVSFYNDIKQPMPRNIGLRGRGFVISVAAAIIFPILCLYTGSFGITKLLGTNDSGFWFSLGISNRAFSYVIGMTIFAIPMLFLFIFTDGKKAKAKLDDFGLTRPGMSKLDWKLIGKAFALSMTVIGIAFAYLALVEDVLGTDIYSLFFGYKAIASNRIPYYIPYIVVFMICFVISAMSMNVERRLPETGNPVKDMIRAMALNAFLSMFAVTVMIIIQNYMQVNVTAPGTGMALKTWGIDVTRLWGMPVGMTVAGIGQTYCYRKTGSVWVGAFTIGTLCALGCILYGKHLFAL